MTLRTGYELREGSLILSERINSQVADAILRRWRIALLARKALRLLDGAKT